MRHSRTATVTHWTESAPSGVLSGRGIAKKYAADTALRHVDIDVHRGEVVAVMGPSGSGKSTLLYCLSGILVPDAGEVVFDGVPLSSLGDDARSRLRRTSFGFVFQFGQLVPELSIAENVALPLLLSGTRREEAVARAHELLSVVGIEALASRLPGEVSGGEGQRAAVCRALVMEPSIVFADEPTGALDSKTGRVVLRLLLDAAAARNAAVVLVTHERSVARRAARVVLLRDGAVASPER